MIKKKDERWQLKDGIYTYYFDEKSPPFLKAVKNNQIQRFADLIPEIKWRSYLYVFS